MLNADTLPAAAAQLATVLPPFPRVVLQLLDLIGDEGTSMDTLIRLARNDPVIASGILGTANRLRRIGAKPDIRDPFIAASLIGIDQVRRIVVTASMNRFATGDKGAEFMLGHSRAVAIVAQELATLCGVQPETAYVAAILHDVGQLCFHHLDRAKFQTAYMQSGRDGRLLEHERAAFGVDHTEMGGALAQHWDLPEEFVAAIRRHHETAGADNRLVATIILAESLTRALDIPPSPKNRLTRLNADAVELLGIRWDSEALRDCFGRCRARFRQALG